MLPYGYACTDGDGDDSVRIDLLRITLNLLSAAYEYYIPLVLEPLPVVSSPSVKSTGLSPQREGWKRPVRNSDSSLPASCKDNQIKLIFGLS